ncbi:translation initiation factor IF-3 ['Melaleuca sp.' phytoplasma]|uniref:Translation initiation factor IF-3 n=1 Tax=Candidatus Phytoplasma melaleucae TaxID=2982630 RepID=A0ABT9DED2_9MOLU|nr:translation initiation factor IF-3 ['Melaleuca sp.' phytoplasma]
MPEGDYLVIDEDGSKLGILGKAEIFQLANAKEKDFVLINANGVPKVVRLVNYSQFYYEQQKKMKKLKKKQNTIVVKNIRVSPNIHNNDLKIKIKKAYNWLTKGDKVKITIFFPGRMIVHSSLGQNILQQIISELKNVSKIDISPKLEGNQMIALLSSLLTKKT